MINAAFTDLLPLLLMGLLAILLVPVFPHFPSPNELTRWARERRLI